MSETEEGFNAADPIKVRARKKELSARQVRLDNVLAALMERREGREFIWALLERCRIYEVSFSSDAPLMAFREGHRNVGLQLVADVMRVSPEDYLTMAKEQSGE